MIVSSDAPFTLPSSFHHSLLASFIMSPPLPPELVDIILSYLPDDAKATRFLRHYALVARAWSIPSQRALFRHLNFTQLLEDFSITHLLAHLRRFPHLQNHIRHVTMSQIANNFSPESEASIAALSALFGLMPRLISMDITFTNCRAWDLSSEHFLEAFGAFLCTSSLDEIAVHGLVYDSDIEEVFSYLENTTIKRVSLQEKSGHDYDSDPDITTAKSMTRLSGIEMLRVDLWRTDVFAEGMEYWFSKHETMFPNLKHLEVVAHHAGDLIIWSFCSMHPLFDLNLFVWNWHHLP